MSGHDVSSADIVTSIACSQIKDREQGASLRATAPSFPQSSPLLHNVHSIPTAAPLLLTLTPTCRCTTLLGRKVDSKAVGVRERRGWAQGCFRNDGLISSKKVGQVLTSEPHLAHL